MKQCDVPSEPGVSAFSISASLFTPRSVHGCLVFVVFGSCLLMGPHSLCQADRCPLPPLHATLPRRCGVHFLLRMFQVGGFVTCFCCGKGVFQPVGSSLVCTCTLWFPPVDIDRDGVLKSSCLASPHPVPLPCSLLFFFFFLSFCLF